MEGAGVVDQQIFNIAVALVGALGGWWMNTMWQSLALTGGFSAEIS